jgi:hypothetical protein
MDVNETLNNAGTVAEWIIFGGGVYVSSLVALQWLSTISSKKIKTQEELDAVINEEAEKLGLDPSKVIGFFDSELSGELKFSENTYHLFQGRRNATVSTARHGLYHIRRMDLGKCPGDLRGLKAKLQYFFLEEPLATLWQIGVKI